MITKDFESGKAVLTGRSNWRCYFGSYIDTAKACMKGNAERLTFLTVEE